MLSALGTPERFFGASEREHSVIKDIRFVFAVVKTGGKQYKVRVGETIDVEKLEVETGGDSDLGRRFSASLRKSAIGGLRNIDDGWKYWSMITAEVNGRIRCP